MVVCLTLDDSGIPKTAEGRIEIAQSILKTARSYGLDKKDLIIDPLVLAVSAEPEAAIQTLKAVEALHGLGFLISLGVSNVSFGLPQRDVINSTFFSMALSRGLDAAIMNPYSSAMMGAYRAFCALYAKDKACADFLEFAALKDQTEGSVTKPDSPSDVEADLKKAILSGLKDSAVKTAKNLLETATPMQLIGDYLIPALDIAGQEYEKGRFFLPQLLMSAEAASGVFELIRNVSKASSTSSVSKGKVVLATVKGDIHDIGKNIVHMLLENYGFEVLDLGKDVDPQRIVDEVISSGARLAGLSALMTTTVPSMEKTIALLKEKAPQCSTVVGGAVLTKDYAQSIGADCYAKDAMATVRYAESIYS